jgi:hypothetical protein
VQNCALLKKIEGGKGMPCFQPLEGYRSKDVNPTGKRSIVFNLQNAVDDDVIKLPCGQCIGCRLERSRQWAMRCVHEAKLHSKNCFITLTYNSRSLPDGGTLVLRHFQLFMKKLRKQYGPGIRYFHCGEYGDKRGRPHYHACLFNHDFDDKYPWKITKAGELIYRSPSLEKLWTYGHSSIGEVTFESAAYVARYVTKKLTGKVGNVSYREYQQSQKLGEDFTIILEDENKRKVYGQINSSTGEITRELKPEYVTMSRRPGIGYEFYKKYKEEIYAQDFCPMNGKKIRPPKFYDGHYEIDEPEHFEEIKFNRTQNGLKHAENNTPERLWTRKKIQELKARKLQRSYEND